MRAEFNGIKSDLRRSKQGENLRWHSAEARWPVGANFNNSLIIGVGAPLDHFVSKQARQKRAEAAERSYETLMQCD